MTRTFTPLGVVIRQGLKSTVVQYVGIVVGAVANLFLYTQVQAEYGLVQVLLGVANLIAPFAMLGSYSLAVRFYPRFTEPSAGRQGFLTLLLAVTAVGIGVYLLTAPLLDGWLSGRCLDRASAEYCLNVRYVPALVVCLALLRLLYQYTSNFRRIVVPTLLEQFSLKITLPAALLAYLFGYLSVEAVVLAVVANYAVALVGMFAYLAYLGELHLGLPSPRVLAAWRPMAGFAGYGIASMLGTVLAFRVDVVMVGGNLGLAEAGQYTIALFIAETIAKPYTNVRAALAPEVSAAWAAGDFATLGDLYRRSSSNLLLIAGYLFAGILVCYPALAALAVEGEVIAGGFLAFVFLGLGRVVDSATSINEYVISFSPRYRFNLVAILVLAAVNVALNLYLIPRFGIAGAALATLTSVTVYNAAKVLFAGLAFGLWPFGKTTLSVLAGLSVATLLTLAIPELDRWYLTMIVRGGALTLLVYAYVALAKPSAEAEQLRVGLLTKLRARTR